MQGLPFGRSPPTGPRSRRAASTGPNLYGIIGRAVASDPDFAYGDVARGLGATGAVWDEASFAAYVADPAA